jgi:acyl carrier protein
VRPRTNFPTARRYAPIIGIQKRQGETEMFAIIQRLIEKEAKLAVPAAHVTPRANLYELGLTSFDAIRLLVAIERTFKVEMARDALRRDTMASIESIAKAIQAATPAQVAIEETRLAA